MRESTLAADSVKRNFLEWKSEVNAQWRRRMEFRHSYYIGDRSAWMEDFRQSLAKLYPNTHRSLEPLLTWVNLVRYVVDLQAQVYRKGAVRTLVDKHGAPVDDPIAIEAFELWQEESAQDELWEEANRLSVLLGTVAIWIQADSNTGELVYQVVPNYRIWPYSSSQRMWELEAAQGIAIELESAKDSTTAGFESMHRFARYLRTDDGTIELTITWKDGTPVDMLQPEYGLPFYPFVKVDKHRTSTFFVHGDDDLVEFPKSIIRQLTDLAHTLHYAGFPMLVAAGFSEDEVRNLIVGANRILHSTSPDAKLDAIKPETPFADLLKVIMDTVKLWGITHNIPPMEFDIKQTYQSGISRIQARQNLLEERERQIKKFARLEKIAFSKAMNIRKAFVREEELIFAGVPRDIARLRAFDLSRYSIEVSYPPVQPVYDRLTELKILEKEKNLGLG